MDDLKEIMNIFQRNAQKLRTNLNAYEREINIVYESLLNSWQHVDRADRRLISVHDSLLSSVSELNEFIIKFNLHIGLNRAIEIFAITDAHGSLFSLDRDYVQQIYNQINNTNLKGNDADAANNTQPQYKQCISDDLQIIPATPELTKSIEEENRTTVRSKLPVFSQEVSLGPTIPVLPIPPRKTKLMPPNNSKQMSSTEAYDNLFKNISGFRTESIVQVKMTHLNISENCIFVGIWDQETIPIIKLLAAELPVQELHQLPNFGEIFAVYDNHEWIIPRVIIYAHTEGGGYDAYLLDYGEHIHLNGDEVIFSLPNDVKKLPAEAIRCYVLNRDVIKMRQYINKVLRIRVVNNTGLDLDVEILEDEPINSKKKPSVRQLSIEEINVDGKHMKNVQPEQKDSKTSVKLTASEMAMLEEIEHGTSDAVVAVLGFKPTDDQRICRFYDPEINGCFKGSNCRMLHQPFAPHGATKDTEIADALPESIFVSALPKKLNQHERVLVTFIYSPINLYVQFLDNTPPMVWSKNDVPVSELKLNRAPRMLDMVLALYSDNCYYRAQIIEELDGVFKVFYVDYGNTEFVTIEELAQCSDTFSLKPHRAISCFLEGIQLKTLSQRQGIDCIEFMKSKILNCEVDVFLVDNLPDGHSIKLLGSYADLIKQMVNRGYVDLKDNENLGEESEEGGPKS